jgi:hypothetical protein
MQNQVVVRIVTVNHRLILIVLFISITGVAITSFLISQGYLGEKRISFNQTLVIKISGGGSTNPIPGFHDFSPGSEVLISANPDVGYDFSYWLLDGEIKLENPITVVMNSNRSLQAFFAIIVEPSPSPTISPTPTITPDPSATAEVTIDGETFFFDPTKIESIRPDLFNNSFSIFDVLVYLDQQKQIVLEYHFDETMNTNIIDLINGESNWWYYTYYSGGWRENNVFRPDHYPWKEGTTLNFYRTSSSALETIYNVWRTEIIRLNNNSGKIVIPLVIIRGTSFTKEFENVEVTPHNLRTDIFREDLITAIDVILSLGDQGKISYQLQWYNSIGSANIVRSYWVEGIDTEIASGRAGWVYEAGSNIYRGFQGNHIHLPSDTRILNFPEYVEFFWIYL